MRPTLFCLIVLFCCLSFNTFAYPIDGYLYSGIRRLLKVEKVLKGEIKETPPPPGALLPLDSIQLNLIHRQELWRSYPTPDSSLQAELNHLFPNLHESYSLALLDISPNRPARYAERQADRGFQPGSVGKLAIAAALFCELENIFPDSFSHRINILKNRIVKGGPWAVRDEHTVPFYNPEDGKFFKRQVQPSDEFSLFEWADHMLSVSNNGAASVVWREAILMRAFGEKYLSLTAAQADAYFRDTPKRELSELAVDVVNSPLLSMGIESDEWRLGQLFTRGATAIISGQGGSIGSPRGLMKFLIALESGQVIDQASSLEIKRLMYMTDRRIRYGASPVLKDAALYFKSGSLYKCNPAKSTPCGKYMGNAQNFMNSIAIIEQPDSTVYIVALMTNVLSRNSNTDHNRLAGRIDALLRGE